MWGDIIGYLALYRKYRPAKFSDVAGQKHIVKIFENSISNNCLSHAYLFSGPRGTGKTSLAKIIAKTINCLNLSGVSFCDECNSCLAFNSKNNPDIIEIDAASNNGVEEIRRIRDSVSLMPGISKYKVYIIDEVHMLSTGAFNALLKTLEEPPAHVIFILATTEFYKIPETIVSRCQCFNFGRISNNEIVEKLKCIVESENIKIDVDVLELIAKYSDGGLRDSISMLDKLTSFSSDISVSDFYALKGVVDNESLSSLITYIFKGDVSNVLGLLNDFEDSGKDVVLLVESLMFMLKDMLIESYTNVDVEYNSELVYYLILKLNDLHILLKKSSNKKIIFEVGIVKIVSKYFVNHNKDDVTNNSLSFPESNGDNRFINVDNDKKSEVNADIDVNSESKPLKNEKSFMNNDIVCYNKDVRINNAFSLADKSILNDLRIKWVLFSDYVSDSDISLFVSYLLDSTLRVAGKSELILSVKYDSVLKNIDNNISLIEKVFNDVMNSNYKLVFVNESQWNNLKNEYIANIRNGKVYNYIDDENNSNNVVDSFKNDDAVDCTSDVVSLFGNDVIEFK